MLNESCIGLSVAQDFTYDWRDLILYHLSVGAAGNEQQYVYEQQLEMLPSFGVIPCFSTFKTSPAYDGPYLPTKLIKGLRPEGTLHMDHKLIVHRLPDVSGTVLHVDKKISQIYDRGIDKGAKIVINITASDEQGPVFTNILGYFNRFAGGFGGLKPPASAVTIPARQPDLVVTDKYGEQANLLYRLTGDTHPLHVDPQFAAKAGFERCIIHGLCSFGYACRLLIRGLLPQQSQMMKTLEVQFRNAAFPGEAFDLEIWNLAGNRAVFRMLSKASGNPILDRGLMTW